VLIMLLVLVGVAVILAKSVIRILPGEIVVDIRNSSYIPFFQVLSNDY